MVRSTQFQMSASSSTRRVASVSLFVMKTGGGTGGPAGASLRISITMASLWMPSSPSSASSLLSCLPEKISRWSPSGMPSLSERRSLSVRTVSSADTVTDCVRPVRVLT